MVYLLLIINVIMFLVMGIDKHKAIKQKYRIPEAHLMFGCICFGSFGFTLGMSVWRHKTQKKAFVILSRFMVIVHSIIIILLWI